MPFFGSRAVRMKPARRSVKVVGVATVRFCKDRRVIQIRERDWKWLIEPSSQRGGPAHRVGNSR